VDGTAIGWAGMGRGSRLIRYLDMGLGAGLTEYNTKRNALGGLPREGRMDLRLIRRLPAAGISNMRGLPMDRWCRVQFTFVRINEFTETGSLAPLQVQDNDSESLPNAAGARM